MKLRSCLDFPAEDIFDARRVIFSSAEGGVGGPTARETDEKSADGGAKRARAGKSKQALIFATANRHKLEEVSAMLRGAVELSTPADHGITEDIPEIHPTLEGNALAKARYIYERTGLDCFADDTGLEVAALDGAPGVRSARYAGERHDSAENMKLLLHNLQGARDRSARFRTVVALIQGGREHTFEGGREHLFEGIVSGRITEDYHGAGGFGYDPIFVPEGADVTFAEMAPELKNTMSHRARAIEQLKKHLMING